jgi:hypothetical protein
MSEANSRESQPTVGSPSGHAAERATALQRMIGELLPFTSDDRRMLIDTLMTFFGIESLRNESSSGAATAGTSTPPRSTSFQFSEKQDVPTPKAFVLGKSPKTDVERVACLAYYLSHYRETPHFKTKDLSALNTESAHRPFSNAALAVDNATKMGYLVPSVKGSKQLSASGEQFVEMLPDREAAKQVFQKLHHRRGWEAEKRNETNAERK